MMDDLRILIVEARYYQNIADELIAGAIDALEIGGTSYDRFQVPGALEIPQVVKLAITHGEYDGVVVLGCVIRGETSHYDIVSNESARAIMQLSLDNHMPIGNGILTVNNRDQARARADRNGHNKGGKAVMACLRVAQIKSKLIAHSCHAVRFVPQHD